MKTKRIFKNNEWTRKIPGHHKKSIRKALSIIKKFPGLIAVVGSSANEKFPRGNDFDIALIGYSKEKAKNHTLKIADNIVKEYRRNLKKIKKANSIKDLEHPLIEEVRFPLEGHLIASNSEFKAVKNHGSANISIEILPEKESSEKRKQENYINGFIKRNNNANRTVIDIIIDYSFNDFGLKGNIEDWKRKMKAKGKNYYVLKESDV